MTIKSATKAHFDQSMPLHCWIANFQKYQRSKGVTLTIEYCNTFDLMHAPNSLFPEKVINVELCCPCKKVLNQQCEDVTRRLPCENMQSRYAWFDSFIPFGRYLLHQVNLLFVLKILSNQSLHVGVASVQSYSRSNRLCHVVTLSDAVDFLTCAPTE